MNAEWKDNYLFNQNGAQTATPVWITCSTARNTCNQSIIGSFLCRHKSCSCLLARIFSDPSLPLSLSFSSNLGWSFQMGSAYQFHSWRVFVLVCAFPSVAAICALTTMPESPRFYLEVCRCSCLTVLAGFAHTWVLIRAVSCFMRTLWMHRAPKLQVQPLIILGELKVKFKGYKPN